MTSAVASATLCRDCLATGSPDAVPPPLTGRRRCPSCGSPRVLAHPELASLTVAHIDCDAFYAAIEKRDDPSLADRPLIIGGGARGVVATCCYIARAYGVRSAMPMFKAKALCPDAVILPPDMARYAAVGRQMRALMLELTPLVEPLSIDEAFLDLGGTERLHRATPAETLARFASRAEREVGISVSVGLSYCKFLAKIASDLDKPRGFAVIGRAEAAGFLAGLPVGSIWGVGEVAQNRLAGAGVRLIGDIQRMDEAQMIRRFGAEGQRLWRLAHGRDDRPVRPRRDSKSVSAETTFASDIGERGELARRLYLLSEKVSRRLKEQQLAGAGVTLKLKTASFRLRTRNRLLPAPTQLTSRIFAAARELLDQELTQSRGAGESFRLIGVGVSHLCASQDADLGDLVDTGVVREKAAETAMDALRAKFGAGAIYKGIALPQTRKS